jgi:hypothetical protein
MKVVFSLVLILSAISASSEIQPEPGTQPIRPIYNASDLVCNCVVTSTRLLSKEKVESVGNPVFSEHKLATLKIDDLYKGPDALSGEITTHFDDQLLQEGERVVLFLKFSGADIYTPTDVFVGVTKINTLEPVKSNVTGLARLEEALSEALMHSQRDDAINAMHVLQGFDNLDPNVVSALIGFTNSPDPEVAFAAIAIVLKAKPHDGVGILAKSLDSYKGETQPSSLFSIGSQLGHVDDLQSLETIQKLSNSRFLSIRFGAMDALRRMKSYESIPTLLTRLDDSSKDIRYVAVITLAEITGKSGDYAPTMNLFDNKPNYYVNLWRTWQRENEPSLGK